MKRYQKTITCSKCETKNVLKATELANGNLRFNVDPDKIQCRSCGYDLRSVKLAYPFGNAIPISKTRNYHTDENHPNVSDYPQGTAIYWSESHHEQLEIIVWNSYSAATGEYQATLARFSIDEKTKNINLQRVSIKYPYSQWNDSMTNPASYVSDRMKRALRSFVAQEKGSAYWRIQL